MVKGMIILFEIKLKVVAKKGVQIAAGGHLGYGALGSLYTNAPPNLTHIYGPIMDQVYHLPNHRLPENVKDTTKSFVPSKSSIYTSNMSELPASYATTNTTNKLGRDEYLETNKVKFAY